MELIRLFTSFHGRLGRMPFATAAAALLLANLPLFALLGSPRSLDEVNAGHVAALLAFAFPHWALSVKRAHDLGRSGWWLLGWYGASIASLLLTFGSMAAAFSGSWASSLAILAASSILSLAACYQLGVRMLFSAGQTDINDFGPPSRLLHDLLNEEDAAPATVEVAARQVASAAKLAPRPAGTVRSGFGRRNGMRPA